MADNEEVLNRVNGVRSELKRLMLASRKRVQPPAAVVSFKTLPDGRVIDRNGVTVYTPTKHEARKP